MESSKDEEVLKRAIKRSGEAEDFWSPIYEQALDDLRFSAGEHWTHAERQARESGTSKRPCLTVDKLEQYIRQVANDMRQNKPAIKARAEDSNDDPESADIVSGLIRRIEYNSRADQAYNTAGDYQLRAGIAWLEVCTDYIDDETFDQDIQINVVPDPFSAMLDPLAVTGGQPDGSSARYGFIFEDMPRDDFEAAYPKSNPADWNLGLHENGNRWLTEKTVRIAKYWEIVEEEKTITGEGGKSRIARVKKCMVYKLCAGEVLESSEFPSPYIGLVPVFGRILNIQGEIVIRSLIRPARDAQKLYDYAASEIMGRVFMAPRDKIAVAIEAIEGHEDAWGSAHKSDDPTVTYNHRDSSGEPLPAPFVLQSGAVPVALQNLLGLYEHDIQGALGMYSASLGQQSNEKSGKAILARQKEGDTSTFDFIDNLARAIQQVGRIVVNLIPKIYDTRRVVRIAGLDDSEETIEISPEHVGPPMKLRNEETGEIKKIFSPGYAKFDVAVTVGPSYSTKRQEAAEFMTQAVNSNPALMQVAGDLWMKSLDIPMAEEIGERLKKSMPPELTQDDEGPAQIPPQVMAQIEQMAQQMDMLAQQNAELAQKATDADLKRAELALKNREISVKEYDAQVAAANEAYKNETERMQALAPAFDPAQIEALVMQTMAQVLQPMQPVEPFPQIEPQPEYPETMQMEGMEPQMVTPPTADDGLVPVYGEVQ